MSQSIALKLLHEGAAAAKAGDKALAHQLLSQAVEADAQSALGWLWLASVTESLEDRLTYLERVLSLDPTNQRALEWSRSTKSQLARSLLQKGLAAAKEGDLTLARDAARNVLEYEPNNEDGWLMLAYVTGSLQEKVTYLERVLQINPSNQRALSSLASAKERLASQAPSWRCRLCLTEAKDRTDKCAACGSVLTLDDPDELLGNESVNQKLIREAVERCEGALGEEPGFDDLYTLGLAYLNLKNVDQGIAHLQAAYRLNPDHQALQAQISALVQRQAAADAAREAAREKAARQAPRERQERHAPKLIMVVDDSPTVRKLVTITLEKDGHRVVPAEDGMEALTKINEGMPDLILLDVSMPRIDGYQLCKLIKKNEDTQHIPVIMLSGKDGLFDKMRGRMAGSTEYLTKPFEPRALLQVVNKHVV